MGKASRRRCRATFDRHPEVEAIPKLEMVARAPEVHAPRHLARNRSQPGPVSLVADAMAYGFGRVA